jgi:hypothetical protein
MDFSGCFAEPLINANQTCEFTFRVSRPTRVERRHGVLRWEDEAESADLERLCQGASSEAAGCTYPATLRRTSCKKWFCDAQAEDERWHPCMPPTGDEGGKA